MSEETVNPTQISPQAPAPGYQFHDAAFVEWWLRSLYLLPVDQQVSAALALKHAVQVPSVHAEADLFLSQLGEGPLSEEFMPERSVTSDAPNQDDSAFDVVVRSIRVIWAERPGVIWLGAAAVLVLVARGIVALADLLT